MGAVSLGCTAVDQRGSERPNILLIVADDMGYSDAGVYGSEIQTPNIDGLARQGLLFTQFHVAPNCGPTRGAMLSGVDYHIAGLGGNPEVVLHGETGTLVPSEDPDALAAALISYIEQPNLAQSHGEAGRARVEKEFSLTAMVQSYEALYGSL